MEKEYVRLKIESVENGILVRTEYPDGRVIIAFYDDHDDDRDGFDKYIVGTLLDLTEDDREVIVTWK